PRLHLRRTGLLQRADRAEQAAPADRDRPAQRARERGAELVPHPSLQLQRCRVGDARLRGAVVRGRLRRVAAAPRLPARRALRAPRGGGNGRRGSRRPRTERTVGVGGVRRRRGCIRRRGLRDEGGVATRPRRVPAAAGRRSGRMTGVRRMWIDLANAPHVLVCEPIVKQLREEGWEVLLTARDHAKTVELARRRWSEIEVVGGASPQGRIRKGRAIGERAANLVRFARSARPTAAFSHGSYAQIVAARACRIPSVTMMDYEHQPANHLSFRLARRVVVPAVFPAGALRRFGAANGKVRRYDGFKEELYLAGFAPNASILRDLGIDDAQVVAVFRTPPDGALYHHGVAGRFDELLGDAAEREGVAAVLLPRDEKQGA